jgi:3-oxoacyl-[acyl-carrier protein] reductase
MAGTAGTPLEGKVVLVTGASRGIGKQVSIRLAALGAHLVLAARTADPRPNTPGTLDETAAAVAAVGPEPVVVTADLSRQSDLEILVATVLDRRGGVDILVNNAGYTVGRAIYTHAPDLSREQWDKVMAINATAPLMLTQGLWASMVGRGGGRVVNVTSGAAGMLPLDESISAPGMDAIGPAYGASKAALNRMANVLAAEGRPLGIAVINVEPGFVLTETMALTNQVAGITETPAIPLDVPAAAITYLCTCEDPWLYAGTVVDGPALVADLLLE